MSGRFYAVELEGAGARAAGKPLTANPWRGGTKRRFAWSEGWRNSDALIPDPKMRAVILEHATAERKRVLADRRERAGRTMMRNLLGSEADS